VFARVRVEQVEASVGQTTVDDEIPVVAEEPQTSIEYGQEDNAASEA
jgi:hypothetical protein